MKKTHILGGLSAAQFLKEYWQKKPLLIRNAFPQFKGLLDKNKLLALACQEDAESRIVSFHHETWDLAHGPFKKRDFSKLPQNWTLLVQGINQFYPEAEALLKNFNFIPHARLDDLMISYATDGSGVGPHFDSYDVFLLQGSGKRLWQISKQKDQTLSPDAPLRILENFKSEQEWLLEPGDMLYLPPNYAHNGVAVGECMTYSIGFRAPHHQELVSEFLIYLQDHLETEGMYADPELTVAKHPAQISDAMIDKVTTILEKIRFGKKEIKHFLGMYLSEPKSNVFFQSSEPLLSRNKFLKLAKQHGIRLDLKSQMLFTSDSFFINGESYAFSSSTKPALKKLADNRELDLWPDEMSDLIYEWYAEGYLVTRD